MENMLHDIFVQEAEENLQVLENLIMSLEETPGDVTMINEAFRAIHSLKGGAGLAGFSGIKDFAHIVEDLFEKIRNRSLKINENLISVILKSMDILKIMISNIKDGRESLEGVETDQTVNQIQEILNKEETGQTTSKEPETPQNNDETNHFYIELRYYKEIFLTGIDPLMFLSDLRLSGKIVDIEVRTEEFPLKEDYDPESLYLIWALFYNTTKDEKDILDVFCFVTDESDLKIINLKKEKENNAELSLYRVNGNPPAYLDFPIQEEIKNLDNKPVERRTSDRRSVDRVAAGTRNDSYIRVPTEKLEKIFNTVSELLISQARLNMLTDENEEILPDSFGAVTDSLKNITKLIQEQVTSLRMMNLGNTFDRFKRVVRDLASERGKKIKLVLSGQETELDKNMIEKLNDPLKHLVRNCIDHGFETREERLKNGKSEEGHLNLSAYLESGKVVIQVSDDGRGINRENLLAKAEERGLISKESKLSDGEILNLIFNPGLSTAAQVTDLSGRGVGMDVVKNSINDLHGNIDIISIEGEGTTFRLFLPLTLAILDGMLTSIGREKYIVPTLSILEIFRPESEHLKSISGGEELVFFRGNYIPLIRLHKVLNIKNAIIKPEKAELIVINNGGIKAAILVDNVLEQYQIVLKSLQKNFRKVEYISSATILGDGDVALIIDIQSLIKNSKPDSRV